MIPVFCFAIYLTHNNIWTEFISYAILGIKTFSNTIPYTKLLETDPKLAYLAPIFLIIIVITSLVTYLRKDLRGKEWVRNLHILMFYDLATLVVIYPISDRAHFIIGIICTLITIMYLVYLFMANGLKLEKKKIIFAEKTFFKALSVLIFLAYIIISVHIQIEYIKDIQNQKYLEHFKYIQVHEALYDMITKTEEYIQDKEKEGKEVIVLDTMAAAINIPINKYYKDYDMLNIGNFGKKSEERNNRRFKIQKRYFNFSFERRLYT